MNWIRYRFHANEVDWRPVKFSPPGPCWCTGYADGYSIVVAYLPAGVDLKTYWPEASNIDFEGYEQIQFSDRFPRPKWWRLRDYKDAPV